MITVTTSDCLFPGASFETLSEACKFAASFVERNYCDVWIEGELIHRVTMLPYSWASC